MQSAADYLNRFDTAMTPTNGTNVVSAHRIAEANAFALAALAAAVIETATYPEPATLTAAISASS